MLSLKIRDADQFRCWQFLFVNKTQEASMSYQRKKWDWLFIFFLILIAKLIFHETNTFFLTCNLMSTNASELLLTYCDICSKIWHWFGSVLRFRIIQSNVGKEIVHANSNYFFCAVFNQSGKLEIIRKGNWHFVLFALKPLILGWVKIT